MLAISDKPRVPLYPGQASALATPTRKAGTPTIVPSSSSEPSRAKGVNGVAVRLSLSLDRFEGKGKQSPSF